MSNDLLRPTLAAYRDAPALYQTTGLALSAFFGGPLGAGIYGAANSFRLNRLARDLPVLLALVLAAFAIPYVLEKLDWLRPVTEYLGARGEVVLLRALGLLCFGAIYLMHREFFRAAQVAGATPLKGWVPGVAAIVAGLVANALFVRLILDHH